jgi:predicted DNA-binding transcriptional regulator AlpA
VEQVPQAARAPLSRPDRACSQVEIVPALLDSRQTGEYVNISGNLRDTLIAAGDFPKPLRLGKRKALRWRRAALDEWIERRSAEAKEAA